MKRRALAFFLAGLSCATLRAQDDHHGPVVYPAGSQAAPASSSSDSLAPDTNMDASPAPAANADNSAATPDAGTSAAPAGGISVNPGLMTPNGTGPGNSAANPLSAFAGAASPNGQADDIKDIRPPFFYLKPLTWLWVLLGILAAAVLAAVLWMWLKPLRALRAKSAYELTLEKLEKARAMLDEKNPEPYAVYVSETVRHYLGQRFQTPSTRRTTEEFLRQMQTDASTPLAAHRDLLRTFLEACDLVKFAHYQPARDELEQVQQRAVSFVTATRPLEGAAA